MGYRAGMLGIPDTIRACLFDLDGVLTRTAEVHRSAWRQTFDPFLRTTFGEGTPSFSDEDYLSYVDGRSRLDGVRAFVASRGVQLPEGEEDDPADAATVGGLARCKQDHFLRLLEQGGVHAYEGSVRYVQAARDAGLAVAVVTASANAAAVLASAGFDALLPTRVDGVVARREHLAGKPAPDTFLCAARLLDVEPARAAVFEDAQAGVRAGRAGGFGWVVGVDRAGQAEELRAGGADIVVEDLAELLVDR